MLEAFPTHPPLIGDDRFWDLPEYEPMFREGPAEHQPGGAFQARP